MTTQEKEIVTTVRDGGDSRTALERISQSLQRVTYYLRRRKQVEIRNLFPSHPRSYVVSLARKGNAPKDFIDPLSYPLRRAGQIIELGHHGNLVIYESARSTGFRGPYYAIDLYAPWPKGLPKFKELQHDVFDVEFMRRLVESGKVPSVIVSNGSLHWLKPTDAVNLTAKTHAERVANLLSQYPVDLQVHFGDDITYLGDTFKSYFKLRMVEKGWNVIEVRTVYGTGEAEDHHILVLLRSDGKIPLTFSEFLNTLKQNPTFHEEAATVMDGGVGRETHFDVRPILERLRPPTVGSEIYP